MRRWWAAVAAVALLLLLWATRYEIRSCSAYGCTLINRWTGEVHFQRAAR